MARLIMLILLLAALMACVGSAVAKPQAAPRDETPEDDVTRTQGQLHITPGPEPPIDLKIEKRQDEYSDLLGYYSWSGFWYSHTCSAGNSYATYSNLGGCCPENEQYCTYATGCNGNQVQYINSGTADCYSGAICDTLTVFNSRGAGPTGVQSVIRCLYESVFNEQPRSYYRATFPLTTSQFTPTVITPTVTATTATATVTASEETMTQTITATPSPDSATGKWLGTFWFSFIPLGIAFFGAILPW